MATDHDSPWQTVMAAFRALRDVRETGEGIAARWLEFTEAVERCNVAPPGHLAATFEALDAIGAPKHKVVILDHGCGSGLTALYLLALGYRSVWGVDIGGGCEKWNLQLMPFLGIDEKRFSGYDGLTLPLPDESVDLLISQQVAEHVSPEQYESYYSEAGRVLSDRGIALHQVPHRLTPYESHTRTWFVHYLPRRLALAVYGICGKQRGYVEKHVFLRWPWRHQHMLRKHIGSFEDLTPGRVARRVSAADYDGPARLRNLLAQLAGLPGLGAPLTRLVSLFLMCETRTQRMPRRSGPR